MNTRTPQQASIEAKEAREAWERGEEIEWSKTGDCWTLSRLLEPDFANMFLRWRPKPKTPITPGRWRMRNGGTVDIKASGASSWVSVNAPLTYWYKDGNFLGGEQHPLDLISKVETRLRPWTREEVPVGALVCMCDDGAYRVIICNNSSPEYWHNRYELINPDGSFKAPCGVEEEVK